MKNKSDAIIALTVVVCSLVLLGALLFSMMGNPFTKPYLSFSIDFEDLTGIQRTSAVHYGGVEVGSVSLIEHLPVDERLTDERVVRAHVVITDEVALPANLAATIGSSSLLGEKHLALRRLDDEAGLLADGAELIGSNSSSILESTVPGAGEIVANIRSITDELVAILDSLNESNFREDLEATLSNSRTFTEDINTLVSGEVKAIELHEMLVELITSLNEAGASLNEAGASLSETGTSINELVVGPEGDPDSGLSERSRIILSHLESFSKELDESLTGVPGGRPGLRQRLEEITEEMHLIVVGDSNSREGLQSNIDRLSRDLDSLTLELKTLIVWSEYVAGTLAERPSRLVWGSKLNTVPTKEEILEHFRRSDEPFPVEIEEIDEDRDDEGRGPIDLRNNGVFIPRSQRE
ncbi:MAG: MlaD family protein [Verrucomicrobiota bacterium]